MQQNLSLSHSMNSKPIPGYSGYVPGVKWRFGSNNSPISPRDLPLPERPHSQLRPLLAVPDQALTVPDQAAAPRRPTPASSPGGRGYAQPYRRRNSSDRSEPMRVLCVDEEVQTQEPGRPISGEVRIGRARPIRVETGTGRPRTHSAPRSRPNIREHAETVHEQGQLPQKEEKKAVNNREFKHMTNEGFGDIFAGVQPGWWSQGEVLRNKERREIAIKGRPVNKYGTKQYAKYGGTGMIKLMPMFGDKDFIPAAGYSGHIPGLRGNDFGKTWELAAKESKELNSKQNKVVSSSFESNNRKTDENTDNKLEGKDSFNQQNSDQDSGYHGDFNH